MLLCRWYLCGICSVLLFTRVKAGLDSGEENALRSAVLFSKWPELGTLMAMFPLRGKYLVKTGLAVLLLFHLGALVAAVLVGDAVDASPVFAGAVTGANTVLNAVSYNLLSVQGLTPLRYATDMVFPARFWVLAYWLLMQSAVFWSIGSLFVVWEGKSTAKFLQTCGERPKSSGDLLRTFKRCILLQGSVAGLALGCILQRPFVTFIGSALFHDTLFVSL
jgi:hypothetical protein